MNYGLRKASSISTTATSATASLPTSGPSIGNNFCDIVSKSDALFDRKIDLATEGLQPFLVSRLKKLPQENAFTIVEYIISMKNEFNLSDNYRKDLIEVLYGFSKYNNNKPFKELTRANIIAFLESHRKTETQDPMHKWIGIYNIFRIHLLRFFKWLYYPDIERGKRPKPSVIENIPQLKRKEKSIYKPSDLWTQQDDLLFLKYCPSKRDKCYHAVSRVWQPKQAVKVYCMSCGKEHK